MYYVEIVTIEEMYDIASIHDDISVDAQLNSIIRGYLNSHVCDHKLISFNNDDVKYTFIWWKGE